MLSSLSKASIALSLLTLPLLTQCGGNDSADTYYNDNEPNDSATITEADLQTLRSGDGFIVEQGDQILVIQMTGANQASLKFSKGTQFVEGTSSLLTWQAQSAGSFVYTLTIESATISDFGKLTIIVEVLPKTATKDTSGKIIIQTNITQMSQDTRPLNGEAWTKKPTILLIQKP